jgi:hypothetical protein
MYSANRKREDTAWHPAIEQAFAKKFPKFFARSRRSACIQGASVQCKQSNGSAKKPLRHTTPSRAPMANLSLTKS